MEHHCILKPAVDFIEQFALGQNISKEDALSMISDECNRVWKTKSEKPKASLSINDATALIYNVNFSLTMYQSHRSFCFPSGLIFPTRNAIDSFKNTLHPPVLICELKSSVSFEMLLEETARALIYLNTSTDPSNGHNHFHLTGKFGVDGSGSHKIRHQIIDIEKVCDETPHLDSSDSILLSCYVPLSLTLNDEIVWENPLPNSTVYARPVSLTRCKEKRIVLEKELEPILYSIKRQPLAFQIDELKSVSCVTECSMVDGKMVDLLMGDSGAFCHYCTFSRSECNDIFSISNGFYINKSYESCNEAWQNILCSDKPLTSNERQGQCHEPIIKSDLFCFFCFAF